MQLYEQKKNLVSGLGSFGKIKVGCIIRNGVLNLLFYKKIICLKCLFRHHQKKRL